MKDHLKYSIELLALLKNSNVSGALYNKIDKNHTGCVPLVLFSSTKCSIPIKYSIVLIFSTTFLFHCTRSIDYSQAFSFTNTKTSIQHDRLRDLLSGGTQ